MSGVKRVLMSLVLMAGSAGAQDAPTPQEIAEDAVETRQSVFLLLKFNFVPVYLMATGNAEFDAAIVERNATRIAQLGAMIPDVLVKDTREFEVETEARPNIWDTPADFADKADNLIAMANKMVEAAATGDKAATLATFRPLGGACGACHDDYRDKKD